jgi:hypothetical protein
VTFVEPARCARLRLSTQPASSACSGGNSIVAAHAHDAVPSQRTPHPEIARWSRVVLRDHNGCSHVGVSLNARFAPPF